MGSGSHNHYYSEKQDSELKTSEISAKLRGNLLRFTSASGTFSKSRIDKGSELLIEYAKIPKDARVLDLGCGYGPVGIAVAKSNPDASVLMIDINERAVFLASRNIFANRLSNCAAKKSDSFSNIQSERFDAILLNPPQTAGKKLCIQMIRDSYLHLNPTGTLQLVARHNKGGADLEKHMLEIFGNVVQIAKGSGYRIYLSIRD